MVSYKIKRKWHKWPGIIFLLPSFIISITAVLLALNGLFRLDSVKLNLPALSKPTCNSEMKTMIATGNRVFAGTKNGLYIYENEAFTEIEELSGFDIRSLVTKGDTLLVASKQGLLMIDGPMVKKILNQEVFGVSLLPNEKLLVSMGKKGFKLVNYDGSEDNEKEFIPEGFRKAIKSLSTTQPYTLHKLVVDLHTGEALVGRTLKPLYIALTGLQMLILTITGFWMLFKKKSRNKGLKFGSQPG